MGRVIRRAAIVAVLAALTVPLASAQASVDLRGVLVGSTGARYQLLMQSLVHVDRHRIEAFGVLEQVTRRRPVRSGTFAFTGTEIARSGPYVTYSTKGVIDAVGVALFGKAFYGTSNVLFSDSGDPLFARGQGFVGLLRPLINFRYRVN